VYADITLESVVLSTLIMWQFLSHSPAKHQQSVSPPPQIGKVSYFLILSHGLSLNTNSTECRQTEERAVLPAQILFLNFLVFPLFCPPPVYIKLPLSVYSCGVALTKGRPCHMM
jgi:hypothetical protein